MPWLIGAGVLMAIGYASEKTGEGINQASNGAVKLAVAGGIALYAAKKMKVI